MMTEDSLFYADAVALRSTLSLAVNAIRNYTKDIADKAMLGDWEEVANIDLEEDKKEILEHCKWAIIRLGAFVENHKTE